MLKKAIPFIALLLCASFAVTTSRAAYVPTETKTEETANLKTTTNNEVTQEEMNQWLSDATNHLKTMSRTERRAHRQEARQATHDWKANRNRGGDDAGINHVALIILAIFIPPLAVALHEKGINNKFWISLLLTILFFIPGMIYSILVITHTIK